MHSEPKPKLPLEFRLLARLILNCERRIMAALDDLTTRVTELEASEAALVKRNDAVLAVVGEAVGEIASLQDQVKALQNAGVGAATDAQLQALTDRLGVVKNSLDAQVAKDDTALAPPAETATA